MKKTKIVPYQTRDEVIEIIKRAFPKGDDKIVGFAVTGKLEHSCHRTSWAKTSMLPTNPETYELKRIEEIDPEILDAAERRQFSIIIL